MTIFYHKLLTREGRVLAKGWTHPSSMTIFVYLFLRCVISKSYWNDSKYHMTLNTILSVVSTTSRERENYRIQAYLSFIQHKSLEVVCNLGVTFFSWFDTGNSFKDPKLVSSWSFGMIRQQTHRGSRFLVGWMYTRFPSLPPLKYESHRQSEFDWLRALWIYHEGRFRRRKNIQFCRTCASRFLY